MALYLLDTNVILRFIHAADPLHAVAERAVRLLRQGQHGLHSAPQNLMETWNVATRQPHERAGWGMTPSQAALLLATLEQSFPVLEERPQVYPVWKRLCEDFGVSGKQVFDARIVAFMQVQGISHLLTFNGADFSRFASLGIVALHPGAIL